jgi:hypothetical protein
MPTSNPFTRARLATEAVVDSVDVWPPTTKTMTVTFEVPTEGARALFHELKRFGAFGIAVDGSDPHVTAKVVSVREGDLAADVAQLWTDQNAWIPGAAREELAGILGRDIPGPRRRAE